MIELRFFAKRFSRMKIISIKKHAYKYYIGAVAVRPLPTSFRKQN